VLLKRYQLSLSKDGNGKIELSELKELLGGADFDDDSIKKLLDTHDTNKDGVVIRYYIKKR
jgi:Ca2+-binding EF-hand superfamily protein